MAKRTSESFSKAAKKFLRAKSAKDLRRVVRRPAQTPPKPIGRPLRASNTWQQWEIALLGTAKDSEIARQIGRTTLAVAWRRLQRGIKPIPRGKLWTPGEDALLGTMPDRKLAHVLKCPLDSVTQRRRAKGIFFLHMPPSGHGQKRRSPCWARQKTVKSRAKSGAPRRLPDKEVAQRIGRS